MLRALGYASAKLLLTFSEFVLWQTGCLPDHAFGHSDLSLCTQLDSYWVLVDLAWISWFNCVMKIKNIDPARCQDPCDCQGPLCIAQHTQQIAMPLQAMLYLLTYCNIVPMRCVCACLCTKCIIVSVIVCLCYRHLKRLLQSVYTGMNDSSADVRGAAMFALGQFSDYLQVDRAAYRQTIWMTTNYWKNKWYFLALQEIYDNRKDKEILWIVEEISDVYDWVTCMLQICQMLTLMCMMLIIICRIYNKLFLKLCFMYIEADVGDSVRTNWKFSFRVFSVFQSVDAHQFKSPLITHLFTLCYGLELLKHAINFQLYCAMKKFGIHIEF